MIFPLYVHKLMSNSVTHFIFRHSYPNFSLYVNSTVGGVGMVVVFVCGGCEEVGGVYVCVVGGWC